MDASLPLGGKIKSGGNQSWDSAQHDQKLIRLDEAHKELTHQIWAQSDQWFVRKYMETAQPIRVSEWVSDFKSSTAFLGGLK